MSNPLPPHRPDLTAIEARRFAAVEEDRATRRTLGSHVIRAMGDYVDGKPVLTELHATGVANATFLGCCMTDVEHLVRYVELLETALHQVRASGDAWSRRIAKEAFGEPL